MLRQLKQPKQQLTVQKLKRTMLAIVCSLRCVGMKVCLKLTAEFVGAIGWNKANFIMFYSGELLQGSAWIFHWVKWTNSAYSMPGTSTCEMCMRRFGEWVKWPSRPSAGWLSAQQSRHGCGAAWRGDSWGWYIWAVQEENDAWLSLPP